MQTEISNTAPTLIGMIALIGEASGSRESGSPAGRSSGEDVLNPEIVPTGSGVCGDVGAGGAIVAEFMSGV